MFVRLFVMLSLTAVSTTAWAQLERTKGMAIFADASFTSSSYGNHLIKKCLNLRSFQDTKRMDYYSIDGGEVIDLVHNHRMVEPVQYARMTYDNPDKKTEFTKSQSYDPRANYHHHLKDTNTDRIMVFMGVNEVEKQSVQNWLVLANEIKSYGKECLVGLPHLVGDDKQKEEIVSYNRKVAEVLKGTDCRIIDPSKSISQGAKGTDFGKGKGLTLPDHHTERGAHATCNAIDLAMNGQGPKLPEGYSTKTSEKDTLPATQDEEKKADTTAKDNDQDKEKPVAETEVNTHQETEQEIVDKNNNGYCGDSGMAMFEADCHANSSY